MSVAVTCCPLSSGCFDVPYVLLQDVTRTARKEHRCGECGDPIKPGDRYNFHSAVSDGRIDTNKTCLICRELLSHFGCEGWVWGQLWEDLAENFFPTMKAGGPCMEGLSPDAKARLFERRLAWLERFGER